MQSSSLAIYEFVRNLGQGGFGTVKLYRHKKTKQEVAIKFIDINSLDSTEDVDRVFNEIRILHNFKHTNIVSIKDSFLTEK